MPQETVAALAVTPGVEGSLHHTTVALPPLGPTDVLVQTIRVGVCGTDREIIRGDIGEAPANADDLVLGHEVVGHVAAIGAEVTTLSPGQIVTATVRRPDDCPTCLAGEPDMCLWQGFTERGIFRAPGFLAAQFVEDQRWLIPVPDPLVATAVLIEPLTVVEKAVRQAELIQQRLAYWQLERALVVGAGPIGILGTLLLRAKGVDVTTVARTPGPTPASRLIEASGAHYRSLKEEALPEIAAEIGNIDLIIESSGSAEIAFEALRVLGTNGVEVLLSITGDDRPIPLPADELNTGIVGGNKVVVGSVNAGAIDFVNAVDRLARFEELWPGLTEQMITNRLTFGPDIDLRQIIEKSPGEIKTTIEFA